MELCQNKTSNSLELLSTYLPSALNECVVVGYACYILGVAKQLANFGSI